jgi:Spy/CpxP family protein refolding chaperone
MYSPSNKEMINMKRIIGTAILAGFISLSSVYAQDGPPQGNGKEFHHRGMQPRMEMMKELNLTGDQKAQLKALREEGRTKMDALKNEQDAKRDAILTPEQRETWSQCMQDKKQRNEKWRHHQGYAKHRMGMRQHHNREMMDKLNLTDQQKAQLKSLREEDQARMQSIKNDSKLTQDQKKKKIGEFAKEQKAKRDAIFTPEQKMKLEAMKKEAPERHKPFTDDRKK